MIPHALNPIVCLADSQLLFWRDPDRGEPWLQRLRALLPAEAPRAAYVGASNGDDPAFYGLFAAAMESLGIADHRMIRSSFPAEDRESLASADLVLLAGGDVLRGWRVFEQGDLREAIAARHFAGAVLVGVSAGAVQLGWLAAPEATGSVAGEPVFTFRLVPAVVGVHEEETDWRSLRRLVASSEVPVRGLGIPAGGGLLYHPGGEVEPVRRPVHELVLRDGALRHNLLLPPEGHGERHGSGPPAH